MSEVFLPELRTELSQGDIVDLCAAGSVISNDVVRRWKNDPKGTAFVYPYPLPADHKARQPTPPLHKQPEMILFEAELTQCVIVSNDCVQLAKASNKALELNLTAKQRNYPWHVVPLRRWPSDGEVVTKRDGTTERLGDLIDQGRVKRYLGFPPYQDGEQRYYADLRLMTPIRPTVLAGVTRRASMTDYGRALIWAKLFEFFSGKTMPRFFTCSGCQTKHPSSTFWESAESDDD